ncbi:MAG: hypothetical protein FJ134_03160 [Deltaproteobacteria bacterium]|nr:hypothetical protein [Deltaproteobacteria bacterium]
MTRIIMKFFLLILGWLLLDNTTALATAQIPDALIYQGEEHFLFSNPLESYWTKDRSRPRFQMWHTANYRGYKATWEIDGDMLYLKNLKARIDDKYVGMEYLFPDAKGRVAATWFSGTLRVPQGKQLHYVHMGYESVYERELFLTIDKGKVVGKETIDNTQKGQPKSRE